MSRERRIKCDEPDWRVLSYRKLVMREAREYACDNPGIEVQVWLRSEFGGWEKRASVLNLSGGRLSTTMYAEDYVDPALGPVPDRFRHVRARSRPKKRKAKPDPDGFYQLELKR